MNRILSSASAFPVACLILQAAALGSEAPAGVEGVVRDDLFALRNGLVTAVWKLWNNEIKLTTLDCKECGSLLKQGIQPTDAFALTIDGVPEGVLPSAMKLVSRTPSLTDLPPDPAQPGSPSMPGGKEIHVDYEYEVTAAVRKPDVEIEGVWVDGQLGYDHMHRYAAPGDGSFRCVWSFPFEAGKEYQVAITWPGDSATRAKDAPFTIKDIEGGHKTFKINQAEKVNSDLMIGNTPFQVLGRFMAKRDTLRVQLTNQADQYVVADAVAIQTQGGGAILVMDDSMSGDRVPTGKLHVRWSARLLPDEPFVRLSVEVSASEGTWPIRRMELMRFKSSAGAFEDSGPNVRFVTNGMFLGAGSPELKSVTRDGVHGFEVVIEAPLSPGDSHRETVMLGKVATSE